MQLLSKFALLEVGKLDLLASGIKKHSNCGEQHTRTPVGYQNKLGFDSEQVMNIESEHQISWSFANTKTPNCCTSMHPKPPSKLVPQKAATRKQASWIIVGSLAESL